jgi:hypothetical protein
MRAASHLWFMLHSLVVCKCMSCQKSCARYLKERFNSCRLMEVRCIISNASKLSQTKPDSSRGLFSVIRLPLWTLERQVVSFSFSSREVSRRAAVVDWPKQHLSRKQYPGAYSQESSVSSIYSSRACRRNVEEQAYREIVPGPGRESVIRLIYLCGVWLLVRGRHGR